MTLAQLYEIRARLQAASPGPWTFRGPVKAESVAMPVCDPASDVSPPLSGLSAEVYEVALAGERMPPGIAVVNDHYSMVEKSTPAASNAAFIAHAPSDVADLLDEVTELRAMLRKVLDEYADCGERLSAETFKQAMELVAEEDGQ